MIYYVETIDRGGNTAGPKAPQDIYDITKKIGGRSFFFKEFPGKKSRIYKRIWLILVGGLQWLKVYSKIKAEDLVILQHPFYGAKLNKFCVEYIKKKKRVEFIVVIHDLESIRLTSYYNIDPIIAAEKKYIPVFNKIICHNNEMKKYLLEKGFSEDQLVTLEIFDYLTASPMRNEIGEGIIIAGNLSSGKSKYIYKLLEKNPKFKLNLFGPYFEVENLPGNVKYFGSLPPDELPGKLEGKFGLVWDGDSVETCSGNTGNYLRYNNPHKTSLYLASGIPVIIWREAALAKFIEENNVGITVNSLLEIEDVLKNISDEEYAVMKKNAIEIGLKLRDGYYYKKAVNEAITSLGESR